MTAVPAKVWYDPNTGRLQITLTDYAGRRPQIKHVTVRAEWPGGSYAETAISVPRLDRREHIRGAGVRASGNHDDVTAMPDGAALDHANDGPAAPTGHTLAFMAHIDPGLFPTDTPEWRAATVLAAFRAKDAARERSPHEPLGIAGTPASGGYVDFTADDLEAILTKLAGKA